MRVTLPQLLGVSSMLALGCAPTKSATVPPGDGASANMSARVDALEQRVRVLEQREPTPPAATPTAGWSCMARCGLRDTQTTEFRVNYRRVTSHGDSAAAAYQGLIDACEGTLYERLENEAFVGGDMRSVCIPDSGSH